MAQLKFYLDTRRPKADGTAPLKIAVTHRRKVRYISTGIALRPEHWDARAGQVSPSHPLHARLGLVISRVMLRAQEALLEAVTQGVTGATELQRVIAAAVNPEPAAPPEPPKKTSPSLISVFERFLSTKTRANTRLSYAATLRHIKTFAAGVDTLLEDVTRSWLLEFDAHLSATAKSPNARAVYMRNLRAVINFAIDEGLTDNYPFRRFRIKTIATPKRSLSVEQLRARSLSGPRRVVAPPPRVGGGR